MYPSASADTPSGDVGFAADEDRAPAEPLSALEVVSLQLVSDEARGELVGSLGGRTLPGVAALSEK